MAGNTASFTCYGHASTKTADGRQQIDYKAETSDVLTALDMQMGQRSNLSKRTLTRVGASIPHLVLVCCAAECMTVVLGQLSSCRCCWSMIPLRALMFQ